MLQSARLAIAPNNGSTVAPSSWTIAVMSADSTARTAPRPRHEPALTGPLAAQLLDLDGFRNGDWPMRVCLPHSAHPVAEAVRTRSWGPTSSIGGVVVAHPGVVLRHLGDDRDLLERAAQRDGVLPEQRIELALECALHRGLVAIADLRSRGVGTEGALALRRVLTVRPPEPPTESYAETRFLHIVRPHGFEPWRQVVIVGAGGRIEYRTDFVLQFGQQRRRRPRPHVMLPALGVLVAIDSREFHEGTFERDYDRQARYDALGFRSIMVTPQQIERRPSVVLRAIHGAEASSGRPLWRGDRAR